MLSNLFQY